MYVAVGYLIIYKSVSRRETNSRGREKGERGREKGEEGREKGERGREKGEKGQEKGERYPPVHPHTYCHNHIYCKCVCANKIILSYLTIIVYL